MAKTGDEVIYLHYFDFLNFYKESVCEILILHAICFKLRSTQRLATLFYILHFFHTRLRRKQLTFDRSIECRT